MITLIAAAAAAVLIPTTADVPRSIDIDGVRATFTSSVDEKGIVHLRGRYENDGSEFYYRVRGRKVEGKVGPNTVRFEVSRR